MFSAGVAESHSVGGALQEDRSAGPFSVSEHAPVYTRVSSTGGGLGARFHLQGFIYMARELGAGFHLQGAGEAFCGVSTQYPHFPTSSGIQMVAQDYDFSSKTPFTDEDIASLFPIVKHTHFRVGPSVVALYSLTRYCSVPAI